MWGHIDVMVGDMVGADAFVTTFFTP